MHIPTLQTVMITTGIIIGNFLYAYMTNSPTWDKAFERSLFQGIAAFILWVTVIRNLGIMP